MVSFGTNGVLDDLGHTNMNSTTIYLGVELEDALAIAGAIEISKLWVAFTGGPQRPFTTKIANVGSQAKADPCLTANRPKELMQIR